MTYRPDLDAAGGYALWVKLRRHAMLAAGDAWARETETVDIWALWMLAPARATG